LKRRAHAIYASDVVYARGHPSRRLVHMGPGSQDEVRICWTVFWTEERSNKLSPHPEEPSRSEGVSKDGRSETVIYGIYGGEARKIRPDFNVLIIDDGTSTLPLRPQASGQTLANVIYGIYARQNK
jgi:hypothetical protein